MVTEKRPASLQWESAHCGGALESLNKAQERQQVKGKQGFSKSPQRFGEASPVGIMPETRRQAVRCRGQIQKCGPALLQESRS